MGFYDDLSDDDDVPSVAGGNMTSPGPSGLALLNAERAAGSAQLVRWGALGAQLGAIGPAERDAWALLNLARVFRRSLASAGIEPSDVLTPLFGRHDDRFGRNEELDAGRFLVSSVLTPIAGVAGGADALLARRFLDYLRKVPVHRDSGLMADDHQAIERMAAIVTDVVAWLVKRMRATDPMFALTDVLAAYGTALQGFSLDHLPDNEGLGRRERELESYRTGSALPPLLERLHNAVPDGGLWAAFDLACGLALVTRMPPVPLLTGLIRRELFYRDLHYPADLGSLYAALQVALTAAERDLAMVKDWRRSGISGRSQLIALATLSSFEAVRTGLLASMAGATWQNMRMTMSKLGTQGVVRKSDGYWELADLPRLVPTRSSAQKTRLVRIA